MFYYWKRRYEASPDGEWYKEHSRAPKTCPRKISAELEATIVKQRKDLQTNFCGPTGAQSIDWHLRLEGIEPPSFSTIKRVIKRNGLSTNRRRQSYQKKGIAYPVIHADYPNKVHQVDFWGPRYLKGGTQIFLLNVMDVCTRRVSMYMTFSERTADAINGILKAWKSLGMPELAQFDNGAQFCGSKLHPRHLGKVIRLCLWHRVQPVFIPPSEPWRNGYIERFHKELGRFFRNNHFSDSKDLKVMLTRFENYHNANHHYSTMGGLTPEKAYELKEYAAHKSSINISIPDGRIPIAEGSIHLSRLIRSNLKLVVFGETFDAPDTLQYQYVVATIDTKAEEIVVKNANWDTLFTVPYMLPEKCITRTQNN